MTLHALQICQGEVVTQLTEWTPPSLPRGRGSCTCQSPQQSPMPHFCWLRRSECCHASCRGLQAGWQAAGLACQLSWVIVLLSEYQSMILLCLLSTLQVLFTTIDTLLQGSVLSCSCFIVLCLSCLCQAVRSWVPCRKSLGQRPKPVSPRKEDRFGRDLDVRGYSPVRGSGPQEQQVRCCPPLEQPSSPDHR